MAKFFIKLPRAGGLCLLSKRAYLRISAGGLFFLCAPFPLLPWPAFKRRSLTLTRRHARPRKTDFSPLTLPFPISFSAGFIAPKKKAGRQHLACFLCYVYLCLSGSLLGRRGLHLAQRSRNFFQVRHHRDVVVLEPGHFSGFVHNGDRPARNAFVCQVHAVLLARRPTRMKIRQKRILDPHLFCIRFV